MTHALTLWLERLLALKPDTASPPPSPGRKPLEIEVERLPDYLWRDLGFQARRRPEGE